MEATALTASPVHGAQESLFRPGENCWRSVNASHATIIVDYANYYRAIHQAMCKAKHSIFIFGWDIDSRIALLRGKDAINADCPAVLHDLIRHLAKTRPDLQIYLNKWDYSWFFIRERELLAGFKWRMPDLPNVHYCVDGILPLGACHHQKIIVVDDEIAFNGGMDIALGRWDWRQHHPHEPHRADPGGLMSRGDITPFAPYHDIQCVVAGEAAACMAELARDRWSLASETIPVAQRHVDTQALPPTWPQGDPPDFHDVNVAIARTIPAMRGKRAAIREIKPLLLDQIAMAENFIYIENQFLTCDAIAKALNRRLQQKPALRVLAVSCDVPKGFMERKALWTGRVKFRDILQAGGVEKRAAMAYPVSHGVNEQSPVRIHSKIMIVDDKFLHVGSANLNYRSMGLDTECDIVIEGTHDAARRKIAAVRTDLIREHTGYEAAHIEAMVRDGVPSDEFFTPRTTSRQHFARIDDERFRHEKLQHVCTRVSDCEKPLLPALLTMPHPSGQNRRRIMKKMLLIGSAAALAVGLLAAWQFTPLGDYADGEKLSQLFGQLRSSPMAIPAVLAMFVIGGLLFFPVTAMIVATVFAFGPAYGFGLVLLGSLASASAGYGLGRALGREYFQKLFGRWMGKINDAIDKSGIISVALVRMMPVAPFSLVNMAFGVTKVNYLTYIAGTFLGLFPGTLAIVFFGEALARLWRDPNPQSVGIAVAGLAAWLGLIFLTQRLIKKWQKRK